jgi:predicted RNA-binding Zn-ribbon protein involved in translation (DUF1610 family)
MAMLTITCPVTGNRISTGVEIDPASVGLIPAVNARLTCPACGGVHVWSVLDATLESTEYECTETSGEWEPQLTRLADARRMA